MSFLPQNYQSPKTSTHYMKLQEGENRIRILSQPIIGWEDWHDKEPVRSTMENKPEKPFDPKKPVKHFWAFIVFNYVEEQIQILHLTQASIRKSIEGFCNDKDWGQPFFYDIKIHKKGEKMDTEYSVNPVPHKPLDAYIISCFKERPINLQALFTNEDPFAAHWSSHTPLALNSCPAPTEKESKVVDLFNEDVISFAEASELNDLLKLCDPVYVNKVMDNLLKSYKVTDLEKIPRSIVSNLFKAIIKNKDEYQKQKFTEF